LVFDLILFILQLISMPI